jgi:hypothetical protein
MTNITYLFGAGASCKVLPLVRGISQSLLEFKLFLKKEEPHFSKSSTFPKLNIKKNQHELFLELINDIQWLIDKSSFHHSIDTFAKKLFLTKNYNDLHRLKNVMSIHFYTEQIRKGRADMRYDSLFAAILNKNHTDFPDNIKILSWNYDIQFELSYDEYSMFNDLETNQDHLRVKFKEDGELLMDDQLDKFCIIKLNGSALLYGERGRRKKLLKRLVKNQPSPELCIEAVKDYATNKYYDSYHTGLSFAWEDERSKDSIIKRAIRLTKNTDVLVVIGYSFPFFNRMVDRKIIQAMPTLKKVYFQDKEPSKIISRFKAVHELLPDESLIPINDVDQFFMPDEF